MLDRRTDWCVWIGQASVLLALNLIHTARRSYYSSFHCILTKKSTGFHSHSPKDLKLLLRTSLYLISILVVLSASSYRDKPLVSFVASKLLRKTRLNERVIR